MVFIMVTVYIFGSLRFYVYIIYPTPFIFSKSSGQYFPVIRIQPEPIVCHRLYIFGALDLRHPLLQHPPIILLYIKEDGRSVSFPYSFPYHGLHGLRVVIA